MAVIVSDSRNAAYDGNLSTANGWYRAEYSQLYTTYSSTFDTSTERFAGITFANAGNCMGIAVAILPVTTYRGYQYQKNLQACLWQILGTTTMTIASPCVVTFAGHGFSGGEEIRFTTTGALPTGITANTHYFVNYINVNTFNLAATAGGANINTSGTQSGTHTLHVVRKTLTKTPTDLVDTIDSISGSYLTAYKWDTGYAVDTTASKWQISLRSVASTGTGNWGWFAATNSENNVALVAWCDTQVTASSTNDALIIVDKIIPDISFETKAQTVVSGGSTSYGVCGWVCSANGQTTIDTCETFYMNTSPGSPITLTVDGAFLISSHATVRFGKSSSRITGLTLVFKAAPSAGAAGFSGFYDARVGTNYYGNGAGLCLYGAIPTTIYGVLASDCAASSTSVVLVDSTGFQIGDYIVVGKGEGPGWIYGWTSSITQVTNIVGNTLTISPANASTKRLAGAYVYRLTSEFGITMRSDSLTVICEPRLQGPGRLAISGVLIKNIRYSAYFGSGAEYADSRYNSQLLLEDSMFYCHNRTSSAGWRYLMPTSYGFFANRCYFLTATSNFLEFSGYSAFHTIRSSDIVKIQTGTYEVTNCHFQSEASDPISVTSGIPYSVIKFNDNIVTNTNSLTLLGAKGSEFKRNTVFGCSNGMHLYSLYNVTAIEQNSIQSCGSGATIATGAPVIIGSRDSNSSFGNVVANTEPFILNPNVYAEMEFTNFTGSLTPSSTQLSYASTITEGSILAFTDTTTLIDNTIQKFGRTQRCGDGLTDTTVHTSGADKYSLRMESTDGANNNLFEWSFKTPTGDILGRDMTVVAWVNIAHANYYGGTYYQLPRLSVNYDDGTVVYAQATAVTGWQKLNVNFTPTTSFGQIEITLSCKTDVATAAQRYVYWDDFSVLYPAGYVLNLGGLDLWANALPITPPIATSISALDVWAADPATFGTGTVGEVLVNGSGGGGGGGTFSINL